MERPNPVLFLDFIFKNSSKVSKIAKKILPEFQGAGFPTLKITVIERYLSKKVEQKM